VDRNAYKSQSSCSKRGHIVLIAPEGTRNPQGLGEAKNGLSYIASKTNATIIPTAISYAQGSGSLPQARSTTPLQTLVR
jgi:1-acyl-sn-glycerol-3-phosphate acyltransferase